MGYRNRVLTSLQEAKEALERAYTTMTKPERLEGDPNLTHFWLASNDVLSAIVGAQGEVIESCSAPGEVAPEPCPAPPLHVAQEAPPPEDIGAGGQYVQHVSGQKSGSEFDVMTRLRGDVVELSEDARKGIATVELMLRLSAIVDRAVTGLNLCKARKT